MQEMKKIKGLLLDLKKDKIIESVFFREKMFKYKDIVPLISQETVKKYNIKSPLHVGGKGFTELAASYSCAGEIIERISLMRNIDNSKIKLKKLNLKDYFPKEELEKYSLKEDMLIPSIEVSSFINNKKLHIPSELIFPNAYPKYLPKCTSSIGTAFNTSKDEAILSAIIECIERNNILEFWYLDKEIPMLKNVPTAARTIIKEFRRKINMELYDLSSEIPCPVICCKIRLNYGTIFGLGADLSVEKACLKAISECIQLYISSKLVKRNTKNILEKYFIKLIKNPRIKFSKTLESKALDSSKVKIISYFKSKKQEIYLLNITPPSLAKYGYVYKTYIPNLLQFGSKESILFKTNYSLIRKRKNRMINPFV